MIFEKAEKSDFEKIKNFYWLLIDEMKEKSHMIGWKKGIYPSDEYIAESLDLGEMFVLKDEEIFACVILNSRSNDGYDGVKWSVMCKESDVLIPHALAVKPSVQGKGFGRELMKNIIAFTTEEEKKALRLDILGTNYMAEGLYRSMGFKFVEAKNMFYEDTGWTEYKMFELNL